jgi:hypothetical protein
MRVLGFEPRAVAGRRPVWRVERLCDDAFPAMVERAAAEESLAADL